MKKTNGKRFLAVVMTFVFVCLTICYTALPISAVSNGDFYTSDDINSILSGNYNFSELTTNGEEIPFSFDNFPMKMRYTLEDSTYYIFLKSDATMLGYNGTSFNNINYTTSYSGSTHLWVLECVDSESFCLKWAQDTNLCLKVNPSDNSVYLGDYVEGDTNQNWTLYLTSDGIRVSSKSDNANVANKSLYYNNGSCSVSTSNVSYVGFFDLYWWRPCTSISMSDLSLVVGQQRVIYPDCYDINGNTSTDVASGPWVEYTTVSSGRSYGNISSVSSNATITAHIPGIRRFRITNRITGATTTFDVTVNMASALAVTPVKQAKSNWCWAACAEMVGKYYFPNYGIDQYDLANYFVAGNNAMVDEAWLEEALEFSCDYDHAFDTYYNQTMEYHWCEELVNDNPMVVVFSDTNKTKGHAVVVIGCNVSGTFNNPTYEFTFIDPFDGSLITAEYSEFFQSGGIYSIDSVPVSFRCYIACSVKN